MPDLSGSKRGRRHVGLLLLYLVLALGLSYPLILHISSHVPGSATWAFDEYTFVWNNWLFKESALNLSSPLHTDLIFFPLGIDLVLHTFNFFNAAVSLPLQMVMGLAAASNITLILGTVLSAYGTYLLTIYVLKRAGPCLRPISSSARAQSRWRHLAAVLAGIVYAFASNRAVYAALGHYDMATTQWLPFYALYLLRTLDLVVGDGADTNSPRSVLSGRVVQSCLLAGLFFTLSVLAEMIFGVFLGIFTLIVVATELPRHWSARRRTFLRSLVAVAAIGVCTGILWSPVLIPIAREFGSGQYALEGWGEAQKLSADLRGFVTPTALNPLTGQDWVGELRAVEEGGARFADINTVFLGFTTVVLALIGAWAARHRARLWSWTVVVFGLFSLGPLLQIAGRHEFDLDGIRATFPMPFALLHYIPVVQANRAPNRNSVLLMLGLAVLAGLGVYRVLAWVRSHMPSRWLRESRWSTVAVVGLGVLLAGGVIVEHLSVPAPLTDATVPEVYDQIAAEAGEFSVIQLPLGWRTSFGPIGSERTQIQYYQTVHGKPIIGGNIARAPDFKMEYFGRIPLFQAIADIELYREPDPELDDAARKQARELMLLYDVRYLVVFPPIEGRWPYQDTFDRTWSYARDILPIDSEPFFDQEGVRAYRVQQPELSLPMLVDLGTKPAQPYRGPGWHEDEVIFGETATWASGSGTELYFPLREQADHRLVLRIAPFAYPGSSGETLEVLINGGAVGGSFDLVEGWQEITVELPRDAGKLGLNRLGLQFSRSERPRDVLAGTTVIGTTGVNAPVDIEIDAAADHAYMSVLDGQGTKADASAGRRGYNVAVLDRRSGVVIDLKGFDTWANQYESERLVEYINQIPNGRIVLAATSGDAGMSLTGGAMEALASIGAVGDIRGLPGHAHAVVGVKGAQPGSALELVGEPGAWLRLGLNPDRRELAAAVDWFRIEQ